MEEKTTMDDGEMDALEDLDAGAPEGDQDDNGLDDAAADRARGNWTARFYDKLPITFKQADIIAKVAVGILVLVILIALIAAGD